MRLSRWLFALAGAISVVVFAAGPALASSAAAHVMATRTYQGHAHAKSGGTSLLKYGGGAIESKPVVFIDYWGQAWANGFSTGGYSSAQATTYINDFFSGVGGTSWIASQNQYCQSNASVSVAVGATTCPAGATFIANYGTELVGTWNDTLSNPSSRPSTSNIATEALNAVAHFGYNSNATYFVFLPSGSDPSGFRTRWCAWHSETTYNGQPVAFANMPYQPDAGTSCGENFVNSSNDSFGNGYFDGFSVVGGHEYAEAETDPNTNSGSNAWVDSSGSETGDKCAWSSSSGNITVGSNHFAVQPLWSNAAGGCVMS